MAFQAAVGTWFAVHILARHPVGARFGSNNQALPVALRLETGDALDDIEVTQSDGGALHIQCKTRANLGTGSNAPLVKTLGQLVRWVADAKSGAGLPDRNRNVAVLAVRADAARTLGDLEAGCRAFDLGGAWPITKAQRNQAQQAALGAFETIVMPAWTSHRGTAPTEDDLVDLARIFRIARFSMDEGDGDWREASRLLGRSLFGSEAAGDAPLRDLRGIVRDLIGNGAPADRAGLLRALRRRGHEDVGAPGYEADIVRLRAATTIELARLEIHSRLPLGRGIPIARESDGPLADAIEGGSLLVVGEPGAGKTGALVNAAIKARNAGHMVVFMSVDRYPGVAITADLASELGLAEPVIDVLEAMPGAGRKIFIIDALDAARGGPAEAVFASLIEEVRRRLELDWTVVASIRTFDLKNGRRFRQAFAGALADATYAEAGLSAVRHFLVPRLSLADLAVAGAASPELAGLLASAPPRLADLLRNIFNLSLAAQLLADGTDPAAFQAIRTQSGLIDAYEDVRLDTTGLQQAAAAAVSAMAGRRRLSVRKVAIAHADVDAVIQRGVLAESRDLVSFAHHVLFDHVAGRFHLAWDDPDTLIAQLAGDTSTALLLAPALRFAVERMWRSDDTGRPLSWQLITGIFSAASVDPVLDNVALRIAVENVVNENDIAGLAARVAAAPADSVLARLLARLARFAAMDIDAAQSVGTPQAIAWARLSQALVVAGEPVLVDPARVLLHALFDHADLSEPKLLAVFGSASRALLRMAWGTPPLPWASVSAIRFVGKSFASNASESRLLLDRILREPRFSQHAEREAPWLAEQIVPITRADPAFAVTIFGAIYGKTISDDSTSWFGGQPSRIMPLSSNRRQDYEHSWWQLGTAMGDVLSISPDFGTRALIDALIGKALTQGYGCYDEPETVNLGPYTIELRGHDVEWNAWDEEDLHGGSRDDDILNHYVLFLRAADVPTFAISVEAASRDYTTASVWTRIFGVGSERVAEVGDLLWPLVERPDFLENDNTLRDAIQFVAAAWPSRSREARVRFETMALDGARFENDEDRFRWRCILGRVLNLVGEEQLELDEMRALRQAIAAEDLLSGNDPLHRFTSLEGDRPDFVREQLRREGVEIDTGPTRQILDASDALSALVQQTSSDDAVPSLVALWNAAMAHLAEIDANPGLHDQVDRASWGNIANAVQRVASSDNYRPGENGLPDLMAMFGVLERLSASRYPQPREQK